MTAIARPLHLESMQRRINHHQRKHDVDGHSRQKQASEQAEG